jgi:hypothetical protein
VYNGFFGGTMRNLAKVFLLMAILVFVLNSCGTGPSPISNIETSTATFALSLPMTSTSTSTPTLTQVPTLPPIPVIIQEGNTYPKFGLLTKGSGELEDNRIGAFAGGLTGGGWKPGDPWDYEWMVNQIVSKGVKRFRVSIDNLDAGSPDLDWNIPQYTIDPSHDALITLLAKQGITMTYVLTFWDKDTWPGGKGANCPRFKSDEEVERYLEFVQFIVHHFKDRIQNYEIWNEPNITRCPQQVEVADYINLVRRAAPVIRQEYPQAKIVIGATSYLGEADSQDYLFTILNSDIMPLINIVSWHPMYGTSPEFDSAYYSKYPSIVQKIKDTASAHGFNGIYEADELTWFTVSGNNWDGWSKRYSDTVSGKYTARGIVMHLGMDVTAGIASALIFDSRWESTPSIVQNLSATMAGATVTSFPVEIDTEAGNAVSYTFLLSNDDKLIAIWNDGLAVKDDPGVASVLTFSSYSGWKAVGIEVLNGFEQELVTGGENGDLVIRDFLIKDYPSFIRLSQ